MSYSSKKRKRISKNIFSWIFLIGLFILLFFLIKSVLIAYQGERKSYSNRIKTELILKELKDAQKNVLLDIEYLQTKKGIEAELRNKFRVVKEGEQMAIILNSQDEKNDFYKNKKENILERIIDFFDFF